MIIIIHTKKAAANHKSYFRGRENRTRVGMATSSWREIKLGCPQGPSLGPMLWNIYWNDLFYIKVYMTDFFYMPERI